ncbi:unnamed protein product [Ilex paraguariensis]|uniref:KANL3/Tex30 alpha/beta hydrolase-like domain-containing protein n=1 Tax=Ilex paraguariensis TaxID=185542 RepID=A0ABC8T179_9AQUA
MFQGTNGAVRDETLLQLTVPVMFVQGSKDGLCPLEKLEAVQKKIKSINELHVIEGGDHSFKIAKKHLQSKGSTQEEAEDDAVRVIAAFVSRSMEGRTEAADHPSQWVFGPNFFCKWIMSSDVIDYLNQI